MKALMISLLSILLLWNPSIAEDKTFMHSSEWKYQGHPDDSDHYNTYDEDINHPCYLQNSDITDKNQCYDPDNTITTNKYVIRDCGYDGQCSKSKKDFHHAGIDYDIPNHIHDERDYDENGQRKEIGLLQGVGIKDMLYHDYDYDHDDIAIDDIVASNKGEVVFVGDDPALTHGFGRVVIIHHLLNPEKLKNNKYFDRLCKYNKCEIYTKYAHLSEIFVNINQPVMRGEKIGRIGGSSTKGDSVWIHHLHFELTSALGLESYITSDKYQVLSDIHGKYKIPSKDIIGNGYQLSAPECAEIDEENKIIKPYYAYVPKKADGCGYIDPNEVIGNEEFEVLNENEENDDNGPCYAKPLDSYPDPGGYIGFGWGPTSSGTYHNGADFAADIGTPVYAVADGEVYISKEATGFATPSTPGGVIIIKHQKVSGESFYAVYGHINRSAQQGEHVTRGQQIGTIRSYYDASGSSLPHLHFGLYDGGSFPSSGWGYSSNLNGWHDPVTTLESWLGGSDCSNPGKIDNTCGTSEGYVWNCPPSEREPLYADKEIPANGYAAVNGDGSFTHTWFLENNSNCLMEGFTLGNPEVYRKLGENNYVPASGTVTGNYTCFSLAPNGGTGSVTANFTFNTAEEGEFGIFFDIITPDGTILFRKYRRLFTDVKGCTAPAPTIEFADLINVGIAGLVNIAADALDIIAPLTLQVNGGSDQTMEDGDDYTGVVGPDTEPVKNEYEITATGGCGQTASMEFEENTVYSGYFGSANCNSCCGPGNQKCDADPVNTAIGNFFHQETDGIVAGLGGTAIKLDRTYNSQALLWTPASMRRYFPDGSDEIVAEPPQYFGKGWASMLGQYLLRVEMGPVFDGIQILYPDGHTANFEAKGDDTFESVSPNNHDVITKEGGDYLLRKTDCDCALESTRFDSDGRLMEITDRNGNKIVLKYDGDKLESIENASGRKIQFTTNGDGRITQALLPEGIVLTYEYEDDQLSAFTDGKGYRTEYIYDDDGQMTKIITPNGYPSVRNTYDDKYRVSEQIVGADEKYTFEYEDDYTKVTDAYGNTTVHHYDKEMRLIQIDNPDGTSKYFDYDEDSQRVWQMDEGGAEWSWNYDGNGNRLAADGPLGWHREWEYNDKQQVTSLTQRIDDGTTRITTFEYDAKGNLIRICKPLGDCATITYDSAGLPIEMVDFAGNRTVNTFDAEGDLITVTDAENRVTRFDHDDLGRVIQMTKPLGNAYAYTHDENNNLIAVDGPLGFHLEFGYDPNDNLIMKIDPNGGMLSYAYDPSDRLTRVKNQLGIDAAAYSYGSMNELTGFMDGRSRSWSYQYDEMLRVTDINGPLDTHFQYQYNPVGRITDWTDANGIITHLEYDGLYRPEMVIRNFRPAFGQTSDTNVTTTFTYDLLGNILTMTDPDQYTTTFTYDLQGRRVRKQDAEQFEWEYTYDPMDNLIEEINARNQSTRFAYTRTYQLQKVTNPEGHERLFEYDRNGNPVRARDANGIWSQFDHDLLDRRIRAVRSYSPGGISGSDVNVVTEYGYDMAGNLISLINPRGFNATIQYDPVHRRTEIFDYEDGRTRFTYDEVNNLLTVTDPMNNTTAYEYDNLNRLVKVTNAENEVEQYAYDKMGNRTARIEADSTITRYGFDAIYRLNRVTQNFRNGYPSGNDVNVLTQYAYNRRGLLTEIINANDAATDFEYNGAGRMIRESDPLDNEWQYEYDGMGNRIYRMDANGDPATYEYYPDDMLAAIRYADGTSVAYEYDPNNNRISMDDRLGATLWEYDRMNRVVEQDDPFDRTLLYGYDPAGNRTEITYPDGNQVFYTYSPNNRMASMTDPADGVIRYTRDKVGNILHIENPNLTETNLSYDRVYRTLTIENLQERGQGLNSAFEYTYNVLGHVTRVVKDYGMGNPETVTETYIYDGLHRLAAAVIDPLKNNREPVRMVYAYDPVGNRLSWVSNDDLSTSTPYDGFFRAYAYNDANQLLTVETDMEQDNYDSTATFEYDFNGNRVNRLVMKRNAIERNTAYGFDPENRLVSVLESKYNGNNTNPTTFTDALVPEPDTSLFGDEDWVDPLPRGNDKEKGKSGKGKNGTESGTGDGVQADNGLDSPVLIGENNVEGTLTTLEYDGGGRRLAKIFDTKVDPNTGIPQGHAGKTRLEYVFDGLNPVAEYSMNNRQQYNFYRGAMGRIAMRQKFNSGSPGQRYWYHYNDKGDVAGLTKHNGNSTHNYHYDPYGAIIPDTGAFDDPHNHYTLTGKEFDEKTGLVWFGARHYDPTAGVWITQDMYRGNLLLPGTLNRYEYLAQNPVNYDDLFGFTYSLDEMRDLQERLNNYEDYLGQLLRELQYHDNAEPPWLFFNDYLDWLREGEDLENLINAAGNAYNETKQELDSYIRPPLNNMDNGSFYEYKDSGLSGVQYKCGGHMGVDLIGGAGTEIFAPEPGYIVSYGWNDFGGGYTMEYKGDSGHTYIFAHLERDEDLSAKIDKGEEISFDDNNNRVIARIGPTYAGEGSTGPHLHLGIKGPGQCDNECDPYIDPGALFAIENYGQ